MPALSSVIPKSSGSYTEKLPRVLLCYDFPPSSSRGGVGYIRRLFVSYPLEKLTVLVSSYLYKTDAGDEKLSCKYFLFPTAKPRGLWGFGWIVNWLNYLMMPCLVFFGGWIVKVKKVGTIVSVAHGYFFIAAAAVSALMKIPFVLFVYDDWASRMRGKTYFFKEWVSGFFKFSLRQAKHVYAISDGMKTVLETEYGVKAELQLPATEVTLSDVEKIRVCKNGSDQKVLKIVYAGSCGAAVMDSLSFFVKFLKKDRLRQFGIFSWEMHIYSSLTAGQIEELGGIHEQIKVHAWIPRAEILRVLRMADILFLPFAFEEKMRVITTSSFPSKIVDYFVVGKPILVLGPCYSTVVQYARKEGFAEVVDELDENALEKSIGRLWFLQDYSESLVKRAQKILEANHNARKQSQDFCNLMTKLCYENSTNRRS